MIWGAFIADGASLGLHWIYAQPRIRRIAPDAPEFLEPDPANYEGVPAYFAHGNRHAGDLSMYGESMLVLLRSLSNNTTFDWQHYARHFSDHFGFGGEYVGYIDTPTRGTLINRIKQEESLRERAMSVPFDGEEKEKRSVAAKVLGQVQILRGDALREKVRETIRQTKGSEAHQELARKMIDSLEASRDFPGTDDQQLPALSKVAVLVAAFPDDPGLEKMIEEAVRVTHNTDTAVTWALFVADLLKWSLREEADPDKLEEAVRTILDGQPDDIAEPVRNVLDRKGQDSKTVAMKVGPACELKSGVPVAIHTLLGTADYTETVRKNIYNCGDSCGRAMVLGPLAGALYGVPDEWRERLNRKDELSVLIDTVCS
jgi:ADP-ribosylglycohydrolase